MTDFFISYNRADRTWAEWIAWQLEAAGYHTNLQAWDFRPGSNFVLEMQQAASRAQRTLAVLSPDYLTSLFTQPEWAAAFVQDPTGQKGTLLLVRVRPCELMGLLAPLVFIDLVDLEETETASTLLAGVEHKRAKPTSAPTFPGSSTPRAATPAPRFPGTLPPIWMVPFRRNPFFTGREVLLSQLYEQLHQQQTAALTQTQAISGLGGIGKTQTAVEYAYRYQHDYQAVLWATATTRVSLLAEFVKIADVLHLSDHAAHEQEQLVEAVKHWLHTQTDWLIILDNADDVQFAQEFMPQGGKGHILLTTRAQALGTLTASLDVEKMDTEEGSLLLLRRAHVLPPGATLETVSAADRQLAEKLVQQVDGLPLALDQAGAYIEETGCSLAAYVQLYQTRSSELLGLRKSLSADHPEPVTTTWSLSFELVEQANHAAAVLLRVCALLAPDAIPEELLSEGASELGSVLAPVAADPIKLNEAIEVVRRYSLLKRVAKTNTLSIHRLVQEVLQAQMGPKLRRQWAERVVRAVIQVFPEVEFETWARCERLLPQVQVCAQLIDQYELAFVEAASLLHETGYYLSEQGRYAEAEQYYQQALRIKQQALPANHPSIASTLHNSGSVNLDQGHNAEAEQYYQQALRIYQKALPANHPSIATTLHELGRVNLNQGRYAEAEQYFQQALHIKQQALPANHPDTAITLESYAYLLRQLGRENEALQLETQSKTK
jgi:tetratricopeptide (TPR) repeat protein